MFPDFFLIFVFQNLALTFYKRLYPVIRLLSLGNQCGKRSVHTFVVFEKSGFGEELNEEVFVAFGELALGLGLLGIGDFS